MGLEPMTSPLPRECSTTELHQPVYCTLPLYRDRIIPATASESTQPGTRKTPAAPSSAPETFPAPSSATPAPPKPPALPAQQPAAHRPREPYPSQPSTYSPTTNNHQPKTKNGAQGRIRTSVTRRVADLQSAAINRSATCALALPSTPAPLHPHHATAPAIPRRNFA